MEPVLASAWWGFIPIQQSQVKRWGLVSGMKEGEAWIVFAPEHCGLHPTSLRVTTSGGCMSENSGANTPPEEMQTARSWKCVSATKPAGLGCGWRQGRKGGLRASSSIRAVPGQALVQTALTHQSSQLHPGVGAESKPAPAPKRWRVFPHGSCVGM